MASSSTDTTTIIDSSIGSDDSGEATSLSIEEPSSSSDSPSKGVGELLNTSSFARRLAHGAELTKQDPQLTRLSEDMTGTPPSDLEDSDKSSRQYPQDVISSDIKRQVYFSVEDETANTTASVNTSEAEDGGAESTMQASSKTVTKFDSDTLLDAPIATTIVRADQNNMAASDEVAPSVKAPSVDNKNPFDAFGEYVAFFFKKAEVRKLISAY